MRTLLTALAAYSGCAAARRYPPFRAAARRRYFAFPPPGSPRASAACQRAKITL